jgi:hypothetical protein
MLPYSHMSTDSAWRAVVTVARLHTVTGSSKAVAAEAAWNSSAAAWLTFLADFYACLLVVGHPAQD